MKTALDLKSPRSTDGTCSMLWQYENHRKLRFVMSSEFYPEKAHQQNAYVALLPDDTDYIWVADADEFYHYSDIGLIKSLLTHQGYTYVEFSMHHFWKDVDTVGVGGTGWGYDQPIDRIFKYFPGSKFTSHRPITISFNGRL
jgi:hypothetical protein